MLKISKQYSVQDNYNVKETLMLCAWMQQLEGKDKLGSELLTKGTKKELLRRNQLKDSYCKCRYLMIYMYKIYYKMYRNKL